MPYPFRLWIALNQREPGLRYKVRFLGSEAFKKKGYKVWAKDYRSKAFKERSFQDNKKKAFETLILLYGLPSDLQTLPVPKGQGLP